MREGSRVFHQLRLCSTSFVLLTAKVVNTKPQRPEMAFTKSNQSGRYERGFHKGLSCISILQKAN